MSMKKISFKDDVIDKVFAGEKTHTLRKPEEAYDPGEALILTREDGKEEGVLEILSVIEMTPAELTDDDAAPHGWETLEQLLEQLKRAYPDLREDQPLFRYEFRMRSTRA